jgi:hypothetical protein
VQQGEHDPVVVTGMHRTGTSMVARALRLAGLWLGTDDDLIDPAPDNPNGFFEHAGIVALDDDLLEATGGAWDHPPAAVPTGGDDQRIADLGTKAGDLVCGLARSGPWGWKDPRTCLTARFWLAVVPGARFVVCLRHPLAVALSLRRRNQSSYAHALTLWQRYYEELLSAVPSDRRIVTHYDAYFSDPDTELARVLTFAGLTAGTTQAARALRPELRHHDDVPSVAEAGVAPDVVELHDRLCREAGWNAEPGDGRPADGVVVRRGAVDVVAVQRLAVQRGRQVESLERRLAATTARLEALERLQQTAEQARPLEQRLDRMEDAILAIGYALRGEPDPTVAVCREAVRAHVPRDAPVLVIGKGDPALLDLFGRPASNFPQDEDGSFPGFALGDGLAAIAHLEALRARGHRFLLVPRASTWWLTEFPAFADVLVDRYRAVPIDGGVLVDVTERRPKPDGWSQSLATTIEQIEAGTDHVPSVLDLTGLGVARALPNRAVFEAPAPPPPDGLLPYLDSTIDVVIVPDDCADREAGEARRVGRLAVVRVAGMREGSNGRVGVTAVDELDELAATVPAGRRDLTVLVTGESPEGSWPDRLAEALADEPPARVVVTTDPSEIATVVADADRDDADVALLETGVLPLPGCLTTARTTLHRRRGTGGVAVKLFASDGSLAAAGVCVFGDGSHAAVAAGSFDVAATWHDYVRPTCWGPGLMVVSARALANAGGVAASDGALHPVVAARLWAAGSAVLYQPDAAAVRVTTTPRRVAGQVAGWDAYGRGASRPPARPPTLDDAAWRGILAEEDVAGGWA